MRKFRRWAQRTFPVRFPVRCYLRSPALLPGMLGYFDYDEDEDRGKICVADNLELDAMLDTCCEEWAHARTNDLCSDDEDPHHNTFWAEYGRIVMAARGVEW